MPNAPGPGEARTLQPWTRMDRPLWQIFLALLAAGFVVQRGGAAAVLYLSNAPPLLLAGFAIQIAAGLATAAGLWLGRRWVIGALAALGIGAVATAILAASLGAYPIGIAIGQSLVAAVATGGLMLVARHEFGDGPPSHRRDSARAARARDPSA